MISPPLLDQDLLPGRFFRRFEQPCVLRSSVARRVHPVPTQEQNRCQHLRHGHRNVRDHAHGHMRQWH